MGLSAIVRFHKKAPFFQFFSPLWRRAIFLYFVARSLAPLLVQLQMSLHIVFPISKIHAVTAGREETTWVKILNPNYSQREGREELFERDRHKEPVAGWHTCAIACAETEASQ